MYDGKGIHTECPRVGVYIENCYSPKSQRRHRLKEIIACKTSTFRLWNVTILWNQLCFPSSKEQRPVVNILLSVCVGQGGD